MCRRRRLFSARLRAAVCADGICGAALSLFFGHLFYGYRARQLLAVRRLCLSRRKKSKCAPGDDFYRLQRSGFGTQPIMYVGIGGRLGHSLYAGENCRHDCRDDLELCDEAKSSSRIKRRTLCPSFFMFSQAGKTILLKNNHFHHVFWFFNDNFVTETIFMKGNEKNA